MVFDSYFILLYVFEIFLKVSPNLKAYFNP